MKASLTATNVEKIFKNCLYDPTKDGLPYTEVKGVINIFGFNPDRLKENETKIVEMLSELPDGFHELKGGGWSFLQACINEAGEQWGEHHSMEKLFCLGIGIGKVKELMPEMREVLPGGMPYYMILN